ncbi:hypothetical protein HMPREF0591_6340, partial [Mycobacterium parascrofulaceum ATCC BAA-614]
RRSARRPPAASGFAAWRACSAACGAPPAARGPTHPAEWPLTCSFELWSGRRSC